MEMDKIKILAVDDNIDNLVSLKAIVKEALPHSAVFTTTNPSDSIKIAHSINPDVILLDIVMPDIDGFTLCQKIKADARLNHIPVVFLTALKTDRGSRIRALEIGVESFLTKPIDVPELIAQIRAMTKIKQSNEYKIFEKERLATLVSERTAELEQANQSLLKSRNDTIELMESLKAEIVIRKKNETMLKKQQVLLDSTGAMARIGGWEVEVATNKLTWTGEVFRIHEVPADFVPTVTAALDFYAVDSKPLIEKALTRAINFGERFDLRLEIITALGNQRWVHVIGTANYSDGAIVTVSGVFQDITDRKRAEIIQKIQYNIADAVITSNDLNELLELVRVQLSLLMDTANFYYAVYHESSDMICSPFKKDKYDTVVEWPATESLPGIVIKNLTPILFSKAEIEAIIESGAIEKISKVPEVWMGIPLKNKKKATGIIVMQSYDNPNAYKKSDIELLETIAYELSIYIEKKMVEDSERKLFKAVVQSPVSIVITDMNGNIEYVNSKFTQITGYETNEVIGKNPRLLNCGQQSLEFYKELWQTILAGKDWHGEFHNKRKDGVLFWENAIISPLIDKNGIITNFVAIKEDITERKKMIDELITAKNKAEESDRLKTAFLQNISHEIRTPMNGILGFADLLTDGNICLDEVKKYAEIIKNSGGRLLELINNMLDLSKIDSGLAPLVKTSFNLDVLMQDLFSLFSKISRNKGVELKYNSTVDANNLIIFADQIKLNQVMSNLLNNAVKFTYSGFIEYGYCVQDNQIIFSVIDTGRGVPFEHQTRIFERFYQADISTSRDFEGAGLGLSICRGLVEMMGGKIWFESEPARGSIFNFTIPLEIPSEQSENESQNKDSLEPSGRVILIAEDDDMSFAFLKVVLKKINIEVIRALNGGEAVEICRQRQDIRLVLMDIQMPEIDGLKATTSIKQIRPHLPVIAQATFSCGSEKDAALKVGCEDYITKPIDPRNLLKMMKKYI